MTNYIYCPICGRKTPTEIPLSLNHIVCQNCHTKIMNGQAQDSIKMQSLLTDQAVSGG